MSLHFPTLNGSTSHGLLHIWMTLSLSSAAYLDDIVIHSNSWEEYWGHLMEVFERLKEASLTLKPHKCHFAMAEQEVRQFLGLAGYYQRLIPDFASIAALITDLMHTKPVRVKELEECEAAFKKLQAMLVLNHALRILADVGNLGIPGVPSWEAIHRKD